MSETFDHILSLFDEKYKIKIENGKGDIRLPFNIQKFCEENDLKLKARHNEYKKPPTCSTCENWNETLHQCGPTKVCMYENDYCSYHSELKR